MFAWAQLAVFNIPGNRRLEQLSVDEADREE